LRCSFFSGGFIRLAYADDVEGAWTIYVGKPVLHFHDIQSFGFHGHVASPDVHVDEDSKELRMYFHGGGKQVIAGVEAEQATGIALSSDGLSFRTITNATDVGKFYFRVFEHRGWHYAIAKNNNEGWGTLYRSTDGLTNFEEGNPHFLLEMRHGAVLVSGEKLLIFYSRTHIDRPEHIVVVECDISGDWKSWAPSSGNIAGTSNPVEVLMPETGDEGIIYKPQGGGMGPSPAMQSVRDPHVFQDHGRTWLFYSSAGEEAIKCAELYMIV
jgi:hypothetical protein